MPRRPELAEPTLPLVEPRLDAGPAAGLTEPSLEAAPPAAPASEADDAVARFEQEMQELETIVAQMERGDLRLEDSLRLFERGTLLARSCRTSLDTAELRVRNLLDPASDDDHVAP